MAGWVAIAALTVPLVYGELSSPSIQNLRTPPQKPPSAQIVSTGSIDQVETLGSCIPHHVSSRHRHAQLRHDRLELKNPC